MHSSHGGWTYYYNFAAGLSTTTNYVTNLTNLSFDNGTDITTCAMLHSSANYNMGFCSGATFTQTVSLLLNDPNASGNGIQLTYKNGVSDLCPYSRKTTMIILCNPQETVLCFNSKYRLVHLDLYP